LSQALDREDWKSRCPRRRHAANGTTDGGHRTSLEAALAQPHGPCCRYSFPLTYERLAAVRVKSCPLSGSAVVRQCSFLDWRCHVKKRGALVRQQGCDALQSAKDSAIQVKTALIDQGSDLYAALTELAKEASLCLLPTVVTQRSTLQNFLLHTYRLRNRCWLTPHAGAKRRASCPVCHATQQARRRPAGSGELVEGEFRLGAPVIRRFTSASTAPLRVPSTYRCPARMC